MGEGPIRTATSWTLLPKYSSSRVTSKPYKRSSGKTSNLQTQPSRSLQYMYSVGLVTKIAILGFDGLQGVEAIGFKDWKSHLFEIPQSYELQTVEGSGFKHWKARQFEIPQSQQVSTHNVPPHGHDDCFVLGAPHPRWLLLSQNSLLPAHDPPHIDFENLFLRKHEGWHA
ncbi:hypothetical protein KP509_08G025700 [Ceratopteris richardii]|uniref:Uncharacterized protein n=1 Tax=Ceratopteris richardii TaxID=49495 RepID=A0A8T2UBU0_CERRI|nr:hypothetical protein KP509_08G025700 [Ceratopteris richardii]